MLSPRALATSQEMMGQESCVSARTRSEERRVGNGWRSRCAPKHEKKGQEMRSPGRAATEADSRISILFQAEDGIRAWSVTGVQTCALPISQDSFKIESPIFQLYMV